MKKLLVILFCLSTIISYGQSYTFITPKNSIGTTTFPVTNGDIKTPVFSVTGNYITYKTNSIGTSSAYFGDGAGGRITGVCSFAFGHVP